MDRVRNQQMPVKGPTLDYLGMPAFNLSDLPANVPFSQTKPLPQKTGS